MGHLQRPAGSAGRFAGHDELTSDGEFFPHVGFAEFEPAEQNVTGVVLDQNLKQFFPSPQTHHVGVDHRAGESDLLAFDELSDFFYPGSVFKPVRKKVQAVLDRVQSQFAKKPGSFWAHALEVLERVFERGFACWVFRGFHNGLGAVERFCGCGFYSKIILHRTDRRINKRNLMLYYMKVIFSEGE